MIYQTFIHHSLGALVAAARWATLSAGLLCAIGPAQAAGASSETISGLSPRVFLDHMIADCFTHPTRPLREAVEQYAWPDAVHYADGKLVTFDDHLAHLEFLRKNTKSLEFNIQQVTYDGEWLAERHLGRATLNDGKVIDSEVATFFHIKNGKIDRSFEVTRPVSGNESDRNIHTAK